MVIHGSTDQKVTSRTFITRLASSACLAFALTRSMASKPQPTKLNILTLLSLMMKLVGSLNVLKQRLNWLYITYELSFRFFRGKRCMVALLSAQLAKPNHDSQKPANAVSFWELPRLNSVKVSRVSTSTILIVIPPSEISATSFPSGDRQKSVSSLFMGMSMKMPSLLSNTNRLYRYFLIKANLTGQLRDIASFPLQCLPTPSTSTYLTVLSNCPRSQLLISFISTSFFLAGPSFCFFLQSKITTRSALLTAMKLLLIFKQSIWQLKSFSQTIVRSTMSYMQTVVGLTNNVIALKVCLSPWTSSEMSGI